MLRSLTLRLALLSAAWVALGLSLAGWLVLGIATEQVLRSFDGRVTNLLDGLDTQQQSQLAELLTVLVTRAQVLAEV